MARILIIDDERQVRELLRDILEEAGYDVAEASDGQEAMKIQKSEPAELIITDLIMPEKEGIETIRELKQSYPDVRIIAMSGGGVVGPDSYLKIAQGVGAIWTFSKPIKRDELLDGIRGLLE